MAAHGWCRFDHISRCAIWRQQITGCLRAFVHPTDRGPLCLPDEFPPRHSERGAHGIYTECGIGTLSSRHRRQCHQTEESVGGERPFDNHRPQALGHERPHTGDVAEEESVERVISQIYHFHIFYYTFHQHVDTLTVTRSHSYHYQITVPKLSNSNAKAMLSQCYLIALALPLTPFRTVSQIYHFHQSGFTWLSLHGEEDIAPMSGGWHSCGPAKKSCIHSVPKPITRKQEPIKKRVSRTLYMVQKTLVLLCRGDQTRTGDPYVPNVVRYQLRYTPIRNVLFLKSECKINTFFSKTEETETKIWENRTFFKKSYENIWSIQKKAVPLHRNQEKHATSKTKKCNMNSFD